MSVREGRAIVVIDEPALEEKCPVGRNRPLRGHGTVIQRSFIWKQLSAIADRSFLRFYFRFFAGAIKSMQITEFLAALRRQIGKKLLIIRYGCGVHKSRPVRDGLQEQNGRIAIAFVPPHALERNRVDATCVYLEKDEIASPCSTKIAQVSDFARWRLKSMQRPPNLSRAFWQPVEPTVCSVNQLSSRILDNKAALEPAATVMLGVKMALQRWQHRWRFQRDMYAFLKRDSQHTESYCIMKSRLRLSAVLSGACLLSTLPLAANT